MRGKAPLTNRTFWRLIEALTANGSNSCVQISVGLEPDSHPERAAVY